MDPAVAPTSIRDEKAIEVVEKAREVLLVIASAGECSAREIAEQVCEPLSSTYRLLKQMVAVSWLEPGNHRGKFRLGTVLLRIGGQLEDQVDLRMIAHPILLALATTTHTSISLCVRRGTRAVCIDRIDCGAVRGHSLRLGDSLPLHSGAASIVLLAQLPAEEQRSYLSSSDVVPSRRVVVEADIERTAARGFTTCDGGITPGILAIGAPILNHRNETEASLSVSDLQSDEESKQALISVTLNAAKSISHALGWRG